MEPKINAQSLRDGRIVFLLPEVLTTPFANFFFKKTGLNLAPYPVGMEWLNGAGTYSTKPVALPMTEVEALVETWLADTGMPFERGEKGLKLDGTAWHLGVARLDGGFPSKAAATLSPAGF